MSLKLYPRSFRETELLGLEPKVYNKAIVGFGHKLIWYFVCSGSHINRATANRAETRGNKGHSRITTCPTVEGCVGGRSQTVYTIQKAFTISRYRYTYFSNTCVVLGMQVFRFLRGDGDDADDDIAEVLR